jgi:hypothetical protein
MRLRRRWLALPVILVVSVLATALATGQITLPGGNDAAAPAGPVPLTREQVRTAMSHPPAPIEFAGFGEPYEEHPLPVSCFDRPTPDGGGTNVLGNAIAGSVLAGGSYRSGDMSLTAQVLRVQSSAAGEVARLLRTPEECNVDGYRRTNEHLSYWGVRLSLAMGDGALAVHEVHRDSEGPHPQGAVTQIEMVAVSGTWLIIASAAGGAPGEPEERDPELDLVAKAKAVVAAPAMLRAVLGPLDRAARTTFAATVQGRPGACSADGLGALLDRTTGLVTPAVLAVHDAACGSENDWLSGYITPIHFRNGRRVTWDAHSTEGDPRADVPTSALAAALEAGPRAVSAGRLVYGSDRWTFAFEPRINTLEGFLGQSDRCGSAARGDDPVCDAAAGRGVVGIDWERPSLASTCDGLPVETRQRLYAFGRDPRVPDLVVRSACRAPTGSWPVDVTVLDGSGSTDAAVVLQNLVPSSCRIAGPVTEEDGVLVVPIERNLCEHEDTGTVLRFHLSEGRYRQEP